jgi:hypothetical protein
MMPFTEFLKNSAHAHGMPGYRYIITSFLFAAAATRQESFPKEKDI